MRTLLSLRTALAAFALTAAAASSASAGAGRIVVMPFQGPQELADDTRTAVVTEVSRSHTVVAPTSWVKARRTADQHELGEKAWAQAAKRAKVDAVVEGKVVTKGGKATLSLSVIDAHEGTEIDHVEITIDKKGMRRADEERVRDELVHMLEWVDGVAVTRAVGNTDLDEMDDLQDLEGAEPRRKRDRDDRGDRSDRRADRDDDDDDDDDDRDDGDGRRADRDDDDNDDRDDGDDRRADRDDDDDRDDDGDDRRASRGDDDDRDEDGDDEDDEDRKPQRGDDLLALFGDEAATSPAESTRKARKAAQAASGVRMFGVDAGAFALSRSFTFRGGADAPADYPGGITKGLALTAALYPMSDDAKGKFGGLGVTLDYARGLGSSVEIGDADVWADFPIIYQEWAAAAHYRHNTPKLGIDGSVGYRSITHVLDADAIGEAADDFGPELDALDGEYGAITAGARFELAASPRAQVGLSAEYLYITSVGAITAADMLGAGQAWGARAQLDLRFTLGRSAYLHAAATYQRVGIEFNGSGDMDRDWEVDDVTDSFTGAQVGVGLAY